MSSILTLEVHDIFLSISKFKFTINLEIMNFSKTLFFIFQFDFELYTFLDSYFPSLYRRKQSIQKNRTRKPIIRERKVNSSGTVHRRGFSSSPPTHSGLPPSHGTAHTFALAWISKMSRNGDWKRNLNKISTQIIKIYFSKEFGDEDSPN